MWSPVFEEPSERGGREETETKENNDSNQNSHSERNHAASLALAILCPAAAARQQTGTTNQTQALRKHTTLIASRRNTPKEAGKGA